MDMNMFDSLTAEILGLYQHLLDQYNDSQEYIKKLEKDVETYFSAATKVRDYEIRVGAQEKTHRSRSSRKGN